MRLHERERFLNGSVEIDFGVNSRGEVRETVQHRELTISLARKVCDGDLVEDLRLARIVGDALGEHLGVARDHGQRRVDLVGHAGGQQADRAEFVGLHELFFELDPFGDVVEDDQTADRLEVFRDQRGGGDVERALLGCHAGPIRSAPLTPLPLFTLTDDGAGRKGSGKASARSGNL